MVRIHALSSRRPRPAINKRNASNVNQRDDLSHLPTREPPAPLSGSVFVYILACSDGAVYVGSAGDVANRLAEHGRPKDAARRSRNHKGRGVGVPACGGLGELEATL
jgi:hypothetical protein